VVVDRAGALMYASKPSGIALKSSAMVIWPFSAPTLRAWRSVRYGTIFATG